MRKTEKNGLKKEKERQLNPNSETMDETEIKKDRRNHNR